MKQFFKFMFASMLGFVISGVILIFVLVGAIAGLASKGKKQEVNIETNSILKLNLNYAIPERTSNNAFKNFNFQTFESKNNVGLDDVLKNIKKAATDNNIKGIYLELGINMNSFATLEEIRNELIAFKKSKKFIIAYGELADQKSYYLCSVADKVYLNPAGELVLNGLSSNVMYLKNMFEKIGVNPELIRHGKFKSAGEPLIADKMSDANREQISSYLGSLYHTMVNGIATARKKQVSDVENVINQLMIQHPEDAVKLGMADGLKYDDEIETELKKLIGNEENLKFVTLGKYSNTPNINVSSSEDKIAIIYCDGEIVSGESGDDNMGSETIAKAIKKVRLDDKYKAIVLRINSPGGSAMASDVIWREVVLAKKAKPVIVSMGSVAASGGYYIAAPADVIVAEPNTITGSIGVFGLMINAKELLNNKLGINVETVKFGEYADLGSVDRPLTTAERAIIQRGVDRIYDEFITKVAEGRKLKKEQVDSIAQGRVWAAIDAKKIGLVDEFGGLDKALEIAKTKAKITDFRIINFPEMKDPIETLLSEMSGQASMFLTKRSLTAEQFKLYTDFEKLMHYRGVQARMSFDVNVQ
ncbi:MAG: signal peptide peptidase SppA [Bacteroidia bacterium]|nr:signal peptide peptidase SppA [Bacteroidia bacterium]